MIRIGRQAWDRMVSHVESTYPLEGCGVMIGSGEVVSSALALKNAYTGPQEDFFTIAPQDLMRADEEARARGESVIGIFHSHPDCDAYFSKRDLEHSCPWFSYVVLSIKKGRFDHANCYRPDPDQAEAPKEELIYGQDIDSDAPEAVHGE